MFSPNYMHIFHHTSIMLFILFIIMKNASHFHFHSTWLEFISIFLYFIAFNFLILFRLFLTQDIRIIIRIENLFASSVFPFFLQKNLVFRFFPFFSRFFCQQREYVPIVPIMFQWRSKRREFMKQNGSFK